MKNCVKSAELTSLNPSSLQACMCDPSFFSSLGNKGLDGRRRNGTGFDGGWWRKAWGGKNSHKHGGGAFMHLLM